MVFLAAFLIFLTWIVVGLDACSPGLSFNQLMSTSLVGQVSNISRDDPMSAVNFAAASLDPATQTTNVRQLACSSFDNRCLWRTSNLSTIPWFQSNYKFDGNVLKYATGTDVQPDGDYAIAVSQLVNRTDYAVLESPSFCQVGNGYLQLMLWASQGVRVQACSKANSATSFDFCTLFMLENQPGPYSVIIPQPSQTPLKIYIVATNFNYTDSQYSGGFAAVDQITYSGTDCSSQPASTAKPPASASPTGLPASNLIAASSALGPSSVAASSMPSSSVPILTGSSAAPTSITLTSLLTTPPQTTVKSSVASQVGSGFQTPTNSTYATEPKNTTDVPDVSVTAPFNEETGETTTQQPNKPGFHLSPSENNESHSEDEGSEQADESSGSGSGINQTEELFQNSGSGSGDNETEFDNMVAAKSDDELDGSGTDNESSDGPGFVFNLPEDVTASSSAEPNNNASHNSPNESTTTVEVQTTAEPTTTQSIQNLMPANYMVNSINQPVIQKTEPKKYLPERIRNLLYNDTSSTAAQDGDSQTTLSAKQQTLINQLYNGRKSALESNSKPEDTNNSDQEELPQIFHPSANNHPRPHHKQHFLTSTVQPPWYEFTTLYPGQRRTPSALPTMGNYPSQSPTFFSNQPSIQQPTPKPFSLNPSQWIETNNVQTKRAQK